MITLNERQPVDADLGPGLELKAARERKRMSLNEAADALHLRPSIVDAIENGNYDLLPGQIFLKGYVRSYARLVGVDEERAIAALQNQLSAIEVETDSVDSDKRSAKYLIPVLLVLAVVAGIAIYLFSDNAIISFGPKAVVENQLPPLEDEKQKPGEDKTEESDIGSVSEVHDSSQTEEALETVTVETDGVQEAAVEYTERDSQPDELNEIRPDPDDLTGNAPSNDPVLTEPEFDVEPPAESLAADESRETVLIPDESDEPAVVETETSVGKIEMTFTGDSWVTVHNGNEKRVIAALKRAGQASVYEGPLPFKLVVGDVSVTELLFNGSPVNWQDYRVRNNRAELELR